jgi:hypothetical protein
MVNTHSALGPNILENSKRINCGVRGPSLIRMEMCTAESGKMKFLLRESSPKMVYLGMEVWKMQKMDGRIVYIFKKKNFIYMPLYI